MTTFSDLAKRFPELLERERQALAGGRATEGLGCLLLGVTAIPSGLPAGTLDDLYRLVDLVVDWLSFCQRFKHRPSEGTQAERRAYTATIALCAPFGDGWRFRSYDPMRAVPVDVDELRGAVRR